MGSGLTTRDNSSRRSAGGQSLTGANLPRWPWSKIGAEPALHVLRRISVVNPMVSGVSCGQTARSGIFGTSDLSALSASATRCCGSRCAVTISDAPFVHAPAVDWILQSPSPRSPAFSANGLPMSVWLGCFQQDLFPQEERCESPVPFGTATLYGLCPYATTSVHHRNRSLWLVNAVASGFAGRIALARKHARVGDVSN